MGELSPLEASIVKHLDREVQYYLHIDMQTEESLRMLGKIWKGLDKN